MNNQNVISVKTEKVLRLIFCMAVIGTFMVVPAFAVENEIAKNLAEWVLEGIYWIALAVIVWQLFRAAAAKNIVSCVVLGLLGAACIYLITKPEVLQTVGEKLFSVAGL